MSLKICKFKDYSVIRSDLSVTVVKLLTVNIPIWIQLLKIIEYCMKKDTRVSLLDFCGRHILHKLPFNDHPQANEFLSSSESARSEI